MGWTNPQTGSDIEMEDDGDYTVTFSMALPTPPAPIDEEK